MTNETWSELPRVQQAATILGLSGLLPFWALPTAHLFGADLIDPVAQIIALYGAVICSFMGGARWGLAMRTPERGAFAGLLGSVMPPLLAWALVGSSVVGAGVLQDPLKQLVLIAALLGFQLIEDWRSAGKQLLSTWYLKLRMVLVAGATTPIFLALIVSSFMR
ncbi:MAG: DUF3429 domain-containing protein [Pseudomonadota bacterium]